MPVDACRQAAPTPRRGVRRAYGSAMAGEVELRVVEPTPTAVVRASTTWKEFPSLWGSMLDAVWSFLRGDAPAGLWQHGHNVMLYKDDVPNIEVGVQVSGPFEAAGDVVPSTLPGGRVAAVRHAGPISSLGDAYTAVKDWSTETGRSLSTV